MSALAWLLGGGLVSITLAFVTLAFLNRKDAREGMALRDLLDKEREETRVVRGQLAAEEAAREVTEKRLRAEQDLRAAVESQRNDAYRRARDYYAARIKAAGVADAVRLVDDLLSVPLPGVQEGTVPAGDPNRTDDDLIAP